MKTIIIFLMFFALNNNANAQSYLSEIIKIQSSDYSVSSFINLDDQYLIPYMHVVSNEVISNIHIMEKDTFWELEIGNFIIGAKSIDLNEDNFFINGEPSLNQRDTITSLIHFNIDDISFQNSYEYSSTGISSIQSSFIVDDDFIYTVYVNTAAEGNKYIELNKIDTDGNQIWQKQYYDHIRSSYAYDLNFSDDGNIIICGSNIYEDSNDRLTFLLKVDLDGKVLWDHRNTEPLRANNSFIWHTQLSSGEHVQLTELDRFPHFWFDGLNSEPPYLIWINDNGKEVNNKMIITPDLHKPFYRGIEGGRGDYFFAHGSFEVANEDGDREKYAHVLKLDNEGDTLWTKNYRHPDYDVPKWKYLVIDLQEDESGDITMLIDIKAIDENDVAWLLKVNEHGCQGTEDCGELVITSVSEQKIIKAEQLTLYPNPAKNQFSILSDKNIAHYQVVDVTGRIVKAGEYHSGKHISTFGLAPGIYAVKAYGADGKVGIGKVVVE